LQVLQQQKESSVQLHQRAYRKRNMFSSTSRERNRKMTAFFGVWKVILFLSVLVVFLLQSSNTKTKTTTKPGVVVVVVVSALENVEPPPTRIAVEEDHAEAKRVKNNNLDHESAAAVDHESAAAAAAAAEDEEEETLVVEEEEEENDWSFDVKEEVVATEEEEEEENLNQAEDKESVDTENHSARDVRESEDSNDDEQEEHESSSSSSSSWSPEEATKVTDHREQEDEEEELEPSTAHNNNNSNNTTDSSSSSRPPPPVWENGILVVTSLHDVEPVLANQRQRRRRRRRSSMKGSSSSDDPASSDDSDSSLSSSLYNKSSNSSSSSSSSSSNTSSRNTNNSSSLVLALIYSTDPEKCATLCATMLQRLEQANRLMQQHWETTTDNLDLDDDGDVGVDEEEKENESDDGQQRRRRRRHVAPTFAKIAIEAAATSSSHAENKRTTTASTLTLAEMLGIDFVPQLVLLVLDPTDNLFLLQYAGRVETAEDIFRTCLHYYYRLVLATGTVSAGDASATHGEATSSSGGGNGNGIKVLPKSFQNQSQVQAFIRDHRHGLLQYSSVPQGMSPAISPVHRAYIEWLLEPTAAAENESKPDDFVLFVQCRSSRSSSPHANEPVYSAFDKMNSLVTNRRDRLFVTIADCNSNVMDGSVVAWKIPVDLDQDESWDIDVAVNHNHGHPQRQRVRQAMFVPNSANHNEQKQPNTGDEDTTTTRNFVEFAIRHSTPSTLWFDRQSTAPIAFPTYRKVHAVLFVDLHHVPTAAAVVAGYGSAIDLQMGTDNNNITNRHVRQREIIRAFRQACQNHRLNDPVLEQDTVCLIVPSTEVRVLNTFGIDLWTPLDEQVMRLQDLLEQGANASANSSLAALEEIQLLPTLLITDQRHSGTRRYYHDRTAMEAAAEEDDYGFSAFIADFWADRLTPTLKTSTTRGARTNEFGVRIVTSESFTREVLENNRHALIMFRSPTCGHCKRFAVIWNQLAEFVTHVKWNSFLSLYLMDVSTDEVLNVENLVIRWVPDIAYISPNNRSHATRYTEKDELGDGVGGIDHHIQVMEWLLQVGDFEEKELKKLLLGLRSSF
jgi:Thioredoxin